MVSFEDKERLLLQLSLNEKEIELLTGFSKSKCYSLMKICREKYNGQAGKYTSNVKPSSLCLAVGTTLEEELKTLREVNNSATLLHKGKI